MSANEWLLQGALVPLAVTLAQYGVVAEATVAWGNKVWLKAGCIGFNACRARQEQLRCHAGSWTAVSNITAPRTWLSAAVSVAQPIAVTLD